MTEQLNHIGDTNKMVSSVDFIIKHIDGIRIIDEYEIIKLKEVFEQAKAMHKEEIIRAASDHCYPTYELAMIDAEQYYNETFKSE